MKQPTTRRDWLKKAGATGLFAFVGGYSSLANPFEKEFETLARPLETPVRLHSNENPFGPSAKVREAMTKAFDLGCRYPYSYAQELTEAIAQKEGVSPNHVMITGGSTEGLKIAGLTFGRDGEIVTPSPTFLALLSYAEKFGAYINNVPLNDELGHDLEEMDKRITNNTSMVYLCNPNNPTGTIIPADQLEDFCASISKRTMTFCDEAYLDFIEDPNYPSMVSQVKKGNNVIVAKTFSKIYGLAGLRIGYLIARPDIITRLADNIVAFTNVLALKAAQTALKDQAFYDMSFKKTKEAKAMIYKTLDDIGLEYFKSHTNFVFFKSGKNIRDLIPMMRKEGVQIGRPFPPYTDWCRISTGTLDEVKLFNKGLMKVMG